MKKNKTILIIAAAAIAYFLYKQAQKKASLQTGQQAANAALLALENIKK